MPHLDFILLIYMGSHDLLHGFHVYFFKASLGDECLREIVVSNKTPAQIIFVVLVRVVTMRSSTRC